MVLLFPGRRVSLLGRQQSIIIVYSNFLSIIDENIAMLSVVADLAGCKEGMG